MICIIILLVSRWFLNEYSHSFRIIVVANIGESGVQWSWSTTLQMRCADVLSFTLCVCVECYYQKIHQIFQYLYTCIKQMFRLYSFGAGHSMRSARTAFIYTIQLKLRHNFRSHILAQSSELCDKEDIRSIILENMFSFDLSSYENWRTTIFPTSRDRLIIIFEVMKFLAIFLTVYVAIGCMEMVDGLFESTRNVGLIKQDKSFQLYSKRYTDIKLSKDFWKFMLSQRVNILSLTQSILSCW